MPSSELSEHTTTAWPVCELCAARRGPWQVDIPAPEPGREGVDEVLLTLGNGVFATRGARFEDEADGTHYPGTYAAGVYDDVVDPVGTAGVFSETVVNLPNWLPIGLESPGGDLLHGPAGRIAHDHRTLDLKRGILRRELHTADAGGHRAVIREERLVSMRHPHLGYSQIVVTPLGWSGRLRVVSWTDDRIANGNVGTAGRRRARHLRIHHHDAHLDGSCLVVAETRGSGVRIAIATRTNVDGAAVAERVEHPHAPAVRWEIPAADGQPVVVDKRVAVFSSRDHAISDPAIAAQRELAAAPDLSAARRLHAAEWRHAWERMRLDVRLAADADPGREQAEIERALRVHLFHVVQTLSRHTSDADVGVPARGLHGEAYGGRVFWDELFVFPVLNLRTPELTRSLLMYRYRRLPEARRLAASIGARGALFPWQSGSDGRDETPHVLFNPRSGSWMPDHSSLQRHAGLAVAFNAWHYFQVTQDVNFLASYGAELLVEIARFWCDRAELDPATGRYHLRGMMGPDEFHDGYPGRPGRGVDDNAYVAVMTSWVLTTAIRAHEVLGGRLSDELWQRLSLTAGELERWDAVSRRLFVPFLSNGLLAQFDGYDALEEFDFDGYRARFGNIGRLDLILDAEGDSTNRYKVSKQADVVMLFYLFSADELASVMARLGYRFEPRSIPDTVQYYLARTTHGSTLSRVVFAWVLARGRRRESWHLLCEALEADLADTQGGTTREGIHLGAMAATVDILQRCFTGLEIRDDVVFLHPQLPDALTLLRSDLHYRGHWLTLTVTPRTLRVVARPGIASPISVVVDGTMHSLRTGDVLRVKRAVHGGP